MNRTYVLSLTAVGFAVLTFGASCGVDREGIIFDDALLNGNSGTGGDGNSLGGAAGTGSSAATGGNASGTGGAAPCLNGSHGCDAQQPTECASGTWSPLGPACDFACVNGVCTGVCVPGTTQCTSGTTQQKCNAAGKWDAETTCEFACIATTGASTGACGGGCMPGASGCDTDGKSLTYCDDTGTWQPSGTVCDGSCESGACAGNCTTGNTACVGTTQYQSCVASNWGAATDCDPHTTCSGTSCGGVCGPGDSHCNGKNVEFCGSNGQWGGGVTQDCAFTCSDSAYSANCTGECSPGDFRCNPEKPYGEVCNEKYEWELYVDCSERELTCYHANGEKPVCQGCTPDAIRCTGQGPEQCSSDGTTWKPTTCEGGYVCRNDACVKGNSTFCALNPGARGCIDPDTAWFCKGGSVVTDSCPIASCYDGYCSAI